MSLRYAVFLFAAVVSNVAEAGAYPHCLQIDDLQHSSTTTLTGRIADVEEIAACPNQARLLVLTLKDVPSADSRERAAVYLSPNAFLLRRKLSFALGDDVTVTGMPIDSVDGTTLFTAIEVSNGKRTVTLRDGDGRPLWLTKMRRVERAH